MKVQAIRATDPEMNGFLSLTRPPQQAEVVKWQLSLENPFMQHGETRLFVAIDGHQVIGRIVASIDFNLADKKVGHIGFFECSDDAAAALSLFEAAEKWLQEKGRTEMIGPMNLSIFHEYRLQVTGFETVPFAGEPRNPEFYKDLWEKAGYQKLSTWSSWDFPSETLPLFEKGFQAAIQQFPNQGFDLRAVDLDRYEHELEELYTVALEIFSENFGFSHLPYEEYLMIFNKMKQVLSPGSFLKLYDASRNLAGFGYCYVDPIHQLITQKNSVVYHTFGVKREFRKTVGTYLIANGLLQFGKTIDSPFIGALAKEGPTVYDRFGAPSRQYSIFKKSLE